MRSYRPIAIVSLLALTSICSSTDAQTVSTSQASPSLRSMEQQFIEQLFVAELQTFFQQVDNYVAQSLTSNLGGAATTQPTAGEDKFIQQLTAAMVQTFFQQLDNFIAQLPTLISSSTLLGGTSQTATGQ
jgi:hypothetical protein